MNTMRYDFLHKAVPSLILSGFMSFSGVGNAFAGGIPVLDVSNLGQTTMTAIEAVKQTAKQVEQYALQLQQYENMVKNTLAPAAYVWSEVGRMQNKLISIQDQYDYYKNGGVDNYLQKFGNVSYYRSSENFNLDMFLKNKEEAIDSSKKANDALAKTIDQQRSDLREDAANLQDLQRQVQGYAGQMEAAQGTNQLLAQQNNQLLQLRAALLTQAQAVNAKMVQENSEKAMEEAWLDKIIGGELAKTSGNKRY